eukprot:6755-Rhodomonas_salina.1
MVASSSAVLPVMTAERVRCETETGLRVLPLFQDRRLTSPNMHGMGNNSDDDSVMTSCESTHQYYYEGWQTRNRMRGDVRANCPGYSADDDGVCIDRQG